MKNPSHHLQNMRAATPLVQNITNYVAMNLAANVLLAAGASPAMVHARGEVGEFTSLASALTINIGTLDKEWAGCMILAAQAAVQNDTPWVLDPVAVGATALRREVGAELLAIGPTVIRGNASEILALAGMAAGGRGADATNTVAEAEQAARDLALRIGAVVAVTGPVDFVTDGTQSAHIANGDPIMPHVTALGCALTALTGAFIADGSPFTGTVMALAYYGVAGQIAAGKSQGPGSFQPAFLDALYGVTGEAIDAAARITSS